MAEVLLFLHAQGQREAFASFADELRRAGHTAHAPDLYDGRTFATLDEGLAYAEQVVGEIIERGVRAANGLRHELVYAGFSLGVLPAHAVRCSSTPACRRRSSGRRGRRTCRCRSTGMDADPIFVGEGDINAARALVDSAEQAALFLYLGSQHYFADSSLPSYDAGTAALLTRRVLDFLRSR